MYAVFQKGILKCSVEDLNVCRENVNLNKALIMSRVVKQPNTPQPSYSPHLCLYLKVNFLLVYIYTYLYIQRMEFNMIQSKPVKEVGGKVTKTNVPNISLIHFFSYVDIFHLHMHARSFRFASVYYSCFLGIKKYNVRHLMKNEEKYVLFC